MIFTELTCEEEIIKLLKFHEDESRYLVLDVETTGLDPFKDKILNIIMSGYEEDSACLIPAKFIHLLDELKTPLVCHNFKFDFHFLYRAGIDLRKIGLEHDTMLLDHLLDENQDHDLDSVVKRRYNDPYKEEFWNKYKTYEKAPKEAQLEYACKDVIYTGRAYTDLTQDLQNIPIPHSLLLHTRKLALCLYDTEISGIKLDLPYLEQMGADLSGKISQIKKEMRNIVDIECTIIENDAYFIALCEKKTEAGRSRVKRPEFNFDSTSQLQALLYGQLKLPVQRNKKRKVTVDDGALEKLTPYHGVVPKLREYRGYQKIFTAFITGSLRQMREGRIYPSFNVNGTVTGRISASHPNLQQLPKEGGVRGIYVPDPGYVFLACDYSQLEVTLAAHFSRDTNLLRIINEGASQHDITAEGLGVTRSTAKTINFAMQYGAGANKIQEILGCSETEAQHALTQYWSTYSGLQKFIHECHAKVEKGEPLINPFGRHRRFPVEFTNHWAKEKAKRQAANSLVQGTGADCTNAALYQVNDALLYFKLGKALFTIHDEILITVKKEACEEAKELLIFIMQDIGKQINLTVPLKVECSQPMLRWVK